MLAQKHVLSSLHLGLAIGVEFPEVNRQQIKDESLVERVWDNRREFYGEDK